jgi:hypothetical protein
VFEIGEFVSVTELPEATGVLDELHDPVVVLYHWYV